MNVLNVVPMTPPRVPLIERARPHEPVMIRELVHAAAPRAGGLYVDATLGAGGHTRALLAAGAGHMVAFDRDAVAIEHSTEMLAGLSSRVDLVHAPFSRLASELKRLGIDRVDGVIADLGVSSMQLDDPDRGMSFRRQGPIDMRMDRGTGESALELIERIDDDELTEIIGKLGEERRARRVARCIKQDFAAGRLATTTDLRRAVVRAVGPTRVGGVDPATRTFQALRMAVNAELVELTLLLDAAWEVLQGGGILAVISFHSLEDRIVKRTLLDKERWQSASKKPIVPTSNEVDDNPRARSAKLRVARRANRQEEGT